MYLANYFHKICTTFVISIWLNTIADFDGILATLKNKNLNLYHQKALKIFYSKFFSSLVQLLSPLISMFSAK